MSSKQEDVVPTMADVARRAGVSASTVSYALTGVRPISSATRDRILRAMRDLGYTPNAFARGLKSKRSRIIAVLLPKDERDLGLSSAEYLFGASDYAQDRGYHLLLWTTGVDALDDLARLARQGLVDGALLMEVRLHDPRIEVLRKTGLAFALIGRNADPAGIDFADTNFDQCARVALRHLAAQGHRHVGFVNLNVATIRAGRSNAIRLRDGITRAGREAGVLVTPVAAESSATGGRDAFLHLLDEDAAITAVIAFNEQAVPGIMAAAAETGRCVPDDLSVLCVDMPAQAALMSTPALTTVGPVAAGIGKAAAEMLIRRLEGEEPGAVTQVLFDGELVVRPSTGQVRARR